jgi:heptose I phosphotransferase
MFLASEGLVMADGRVARILRGVWRIQFHSDWPASALRDGDAIMAAHIHDRFHAKQGRSIARWTVNAGARPLIAYLKRHYRAPWMNGWLAALWPERNWSAAWREAAQHHWAADRGFRVPRVLSVGERAGPFGKLQSYLALEELTGMRALHEIIPAAAQVLDPPNFLAWKRELVVGLSRLVARLHSLRRFHKDLYLCHFFVSERAIRCPPDEWDGEIAMIDLHRLVHHPMTAPWWRLKDLAQLLYSSDVPGVTPRDRLRFARAYAGPDRTSLYWRFVRWAVGIRWRKYQRHNRTKKMNRAA